MPIYDYACGACSHLLEVIHGIHDEGPRFCPSCGVEGQMRKAFAPPAVVFKGSGWAKKDRSATAGRGTAATSKDAAGSDGSGKVTDRSATTDGATTSGSAAAPGSGSSGD
jgi:putative FmdB family regulatory protein